MQHSLNGFADVDYYLTLLLNLSLAVYSHSYPSYGVEESHDNTLAYGDFSLFAINTLILSRLAGVILFFYGEMIGYPVS